MVKIRKRQLGIAAFSNYHLPSNKKDSPHRWIFTLNEPLPMLCDITKVFPEYKIRLPLKVPCTLLLLMDVIVTSGWYE
jgi:hypothetical protein